MRIARLALVLAALAGFAQAPALAGDAWPVEHEAGQNCGADGPRSDDAHLSVTTLGPQVLLLIAADAFPRKEASYPVTFAFDGAAPEPFNAVGADGVFGVAVTPPLHEQLVSATRLRVSAAGRDYDFALAGVGEAIDGVLKCANFGSYAQITTFAAKDIPGTDWKLLDPVPTTNDCAARRTQDAVNTTLALNNDDAVLLVAGRGDWAFPPAEHPVTLQFGNAPSLATKGFVVNNVFFTLLTDPQVAALKAAPSVTWTLPWGTFKADIPGVSAALDAVRVCHARRKPAK